LIRCIIEDGPALKRPPHRLFAPAVAGVEEEDLVMADISIAYSRKISWQAYRRVAPVALGLALLCAPALAEDAVGKVGELIETKPAKPVPELTLTDLAQEQPANLDAYKGKALIVNLWATWCGPCVTEMPSLAKLADRLKDQGVVVVAISEDRGGKFVVDPFLKEHNITNLQVYLDKTMSTGKALKEATILPMTILIDANGNEIGRVKGDRDWDSPESRAEITKLFGLKS
jgi:thiol-disulfide isomerase/thioredoxin